MSKSDKSKTTVDRRTFLSQTGAAVATTASIAASTTSGHGAGSPHTEVASPPSVRTAKHHLSLMTPWSDAPFGLSAHAHELAQAIKVLSNNTIDVTIISCDGDQSDSENTLRLDTEQRYVSTHPAFSFFAGLPARRSLDANSLEAWLTVGGGQDLWDQLAGEFGEKPLLAGHLGAAPGLWSKSPIHSLADLKASTVQSSGLGHEILKAVGVTTKTVAPNRMAAALDDGTLTAIEFGNPFVNHMIGIHTHAKHVATGELHVNGSMLSLRVKRALWDRLSPSHQAALSAAAMQSFRRSLNETQAHAKFIKTNMMRYDGVEFSGLPAEIRATLNKVSEAIVAQAAGTDELSRRIDSGYMGFRRAISQQIPMM